MNQKTSDVNTQGEGHGNGKPKLKLNEEFIKQIDGKDFVLYAGLLDLAHQKGLKSLIVEIIQFPSKENDSTCICKAVAISFNGEEFIDYGDANPHNCNPKVAKHLIRMASTRAKARCFRDMTNVGITAIEELYDADIGDKSSNGQNKRQQRTPSSQKNQVEKPQTTPAPATETPQAQSKAPEEKQNDAPSQKSASTAESVPAMSAAQRRAVINISKRRGIEEDQLENMVNDNFHIPFDQLSSRDASSFIKLLQQAA